MNNILSSIVTAIKQNIASTPAYPEHAKAEAQRLIHETSLSAPQAYVVAGDNADVPDRVIDREIVWSGRSIEEVRFSLRETQLDLKDEVGEKQQSVSAIEDWDGSA